MLFRSSRLHLAHDGLARSGLAAVCGERTRPSVHRADAVGQIDWVAIYNDIERGLGANGRLAPVRSLASKAPEHIARLAGTFAVFDGDAQIDTSHIDRAALLMQHYLAEALRLW